MLSSRYGPQGLTGVEVISATYFFGFGGIAIGGATSQNLLPDGKPDLISGGGASCAIA